MKAVFQTKQVSTRRKFWKEKQTGCRHELSSSVKQCILIIIELYFFVHNSFTLSLMKAMTTTISPSQSGTVQWTNGTCVNIYSFYHLVGNQSSIWRRNDDWKYVPAIFSFWTIHMVIIMSKLSAYLKRQRKGYLRLSETRWGWKFWLTFFGRGVSPNIQSRRVSLRLEGSCRTVALRKNFCWQTGELQCHP